MHHLETLVDQVEQGGRADVVDNERPRGRLRRALAFRRRCRLLAFGLGTLAQPRVGGRQALHDDLLLDAHQLLGRLAAERQARAERADQRVETHLECCRAFDHWQLVLLLVGRIEVDRDDQVAMAGYHRNNRQRVENAAVDQHPITLHHRSEQAGDRRRGAHGLVQAPLLEPDFLLVGQVGGHRCVGNAQLFDVDLTDDLADLPEHLVAPYGAQAKTHVDQAQHVEVVQALDPAAVLIELAGGIDTADHGAHRAAGDTADFIAAPFDLLDHADVRVPPCAARAKYQCHAFAHDFPPGHVPPWSYNAPNATCASM